MVSDKQFVKQLTDLLLGREGDYCIVRAVVLIVCCKCIAVGTKNRCQKRLLSL